MPIDPRELSNFRHHQQGVITTDRLCGKCSYNLKGLKPGGVCPECGQPMVAAGGASRLTDTLANAPLQYLRRLVFGLATMTLGAVAGAIILYLVPIGEFKAVAISACGMVWWFGIFIVTGPRESGPNAIRDAMLDSSRLRMANRIIQSAWIFAGIGWLGIAQQAGAGGGASAVGFILIAGLFPIVGLLGFIPLSMQLSSLADWAGYTSLGDRFRATAWALALSGTLVTGAFMLHFLATIFVGLFELILFISAVIVAIIQLIFLICLLQLLFTVEWSIHNAQFAQNRERRRVERLLNPDPERFCPQCNYSLRGLPAMSQCPECGWIDPDIRGSHLAAIAALRRKP